MYLSINIYIEKQMFTGKGLIKAPYQMIGHIDVPGLEELMV